jgi:hypothetical protein
MIPSVFGGSTGRFSDENPKSQIPNPKEIAKDWNDQRIKEHRFETAVLPESSFGSLEFTWELGFGFWDFRGGFSRGVGA